MRTRCRQRGALRVPYAVGAGGGLLVLLLVALWLQPPRAWLSGTVARTDGKPLRQGFVTVRGLEGPARGLVWRRRVDERGRWSSGVLPGTLEVNAEVRVSGNWLCTEPRVVRLREGESATCPIVFDPSRCSDASMHFLMPERVFCTDEKPTLGLVGVLLKGEHAQVLVDRLDLDGLLAAGRAEAWFKAWSGPLDDTALRRLAPYLTRVAAVPVQTTARKRDGSSQQYAELDLHRPGCYLATVISGGLAARAAFQITDLALVAKADHQQVVFYTCRLRDGAPWPQARLELLTGRGRPVATVRPGGTGLSRLPLPAGRRALAALARSGEHAALAQITVDKHTGEERRVVHLYTDRPVYRPGQTAYLKGVVRDRTLTGYVTPTPEAVEVTVADGRGQKVQQLKCRTSDQGTFDCTIELPAEAFTGEWDIEAKVGEGRGSLSLPVKSYVKPVYQVKVHGPAEPLVRGSAAKFDISAEYYFGAAVGGAEVRYVVRRRETWQRPWLQQAGADESWAERLYRGAEGDLDEEDSGEGRQVLTGVGRLDAAGRLSLSLPTDQLVEAVEATIRSDEAGRPVVPRDSAAQALYLEVHVLDGTGRSEGGGASATVLPASVALDATSPDYDVQPGSQVTTTVRAVTPRGRPVPRQELTVQLIRQRSVEDCRARYRDDPRQPWIRRLVPPGEYAGCPTGGGCPYAHGWRALSETVWSRAVRADEHGRAVVPVKVAGTGGYQLVVLAADETGRRAVASHTFWVGSNWHSTRTDVALELKLKAGRPRYQLSESAEVRVQASVPDQAVWVTHEGASLREPQVLRLTDGTAVAQVGLDLTDLPNATIGAVAVRDKQLFDEHTDLRIDLKPKRLEVAVTCDAKQAQPRQTVNYTVTCRRDGQPVDAEVSLAVVDESLFAIRPERPEETVLAFYGWHANSVQTFFSSPDFRFEASKDSGGATRRYFPDTALWQPRLRTGPSGQVTVPLTLPDSVTTWRATARAYSAATEVGFATTKVRVSKPLMVRLETPRFLTQGDRTVVVAEVNNETGRPQVVDLNLQPGTLALRGAAATRLQVPDGGRRSATWSLTAGDAAEAKLTASAQAGDYQDSVLKVMPIKPYAFVRTETRRGALSDGREETVAFQLPREVVLSASQVEVSVATSVAGLVATAVEGLAEYPYGCVEQTASRFLGTLALLRAYEALGWRLEEPVSRRSAERRVRDGLMRLRKLQQEDGGWSWFEGGTVDLYMSAYALDAMLTAREAGFVLPGDHIEAGLKQIAEAVKHPPGETSDWNDYALAAEVLTRARQGGARAMVASYCEGRSKPSLEAAARMLRAAWALRDAGLIKSAEELWAMRLKQADWKAASIGDVAWALRVEVAQHGAGARAAELVELLQARFAGRLFGCTRDTRLAVEALTDYLKASGAEAVKGRLTLAVNGKAPREFVFDQTTARGRGCLQRFEAGDLAAGANQVTLRWQGSGRPQFRCSITTAVGGAKLSKSGEVAVVTRKFTRAVRGDRGRWNYLEFSGPLAGQELVRVTVEARTNQALDHLLLVDPLPAGFEVAEQGEGPDEWFGDGGHYAARDVKDDHVAFFFDRLGPGRSAKVSYLLRAVFAGEYHALPPKLEPMFQPRRSSHGQEAELAIR